jgi:hypothetical protein
MTAPPMSHSTAACARLAMGAITAIPITMTSSASIVSSNFAVPSPLATPGRGDSVSRCDRKHSSALSARQRRSDDGLGRWADGDREPSPRARVGWLQSCCGTDGLGRSISRCWDQPPTSQVGVRVQAGEQASLTGLVAGDQDRG